MNLWVTLIVIALVAGTGLLVAVRVYASDGEPINVFRHKVTDIQGQEVDLSKYIGDVVMVVNVASKCGFTPQYEALEELYQEYKERGFVILGFPANDFLRQEPGSNEEIATFCRMNYGVTFPIFSKVSVIGRKKTPLYQDLTSRATNPNYGGGVKWNFTKFLVGRDGKVINRFAPTTSPDADRVIEAIEQALKQAPKD